MTSGSRPCLVTVFVLTTKAMKHICREALPFALVTLFIFGGCTRNSKHQPIVGVAFESLQSEGWVVGFETIKQELGKRHFEVLEAIANSDANRQYEQINTFISRKVDGIIIAPVDAQTVIPMIKAANEANIPIVLYNRPPAENDAKWVAVVNDNYALTKATVESMAQLALNSHRKYKAMILIGSLTDFNAVQRRDGFEDALKPYAGTIDVVARISTDWNQEKALAGVTNALQAHPDIGFIFCSSDFMLPSVESALKIAGKYKKFSEPDHILLGSFDGDGTAYKMMVDGYLDADGAQDLPLEGVASVQAIADLREGKKVPQTIVDKGLVVTQSNLHEIGSQMWGSRFGQK
jgi:ABC-type sugar transport system substrate-binding protein